MNNSALWLLAVVLSLLPGGCGKGPHTDEGEPSTAREASPPAHETPPSPQKTITNSIGMKLVLIPAGEFMMGSPDSEQGRDNDEGPQHRVRITEPFWLGVYEVTQEEYEKIMGKNPSPRKHPRRPVEWVRWAEAVEFCRKLSQKEGKEYRLPTEAEWEYACRAGTTTRYSFGDDKMELRDYAWGKWNSSLTTYPVGRKKPNAWGLYDMHGNVCEWCADWYDERYYAESPTDDPKGPDTGGTRVFRGGSGSDEPDRIRSANRDRVTPIDRRLYCGFRVVTTP